MRGYLHLGLIAVPKHMVFVDEKPEVKPKAGLSLAAGGHGVSALSVPPAGALPARGSCARLCCPPEPGQRNCARSGAASSFASSWTLHLRESSHACLQRSLDYFADGETLLQPPKTAGSMIPRQNQTPMREWLCPFTQPESSLTACPQRHLPMFSVPDLLITI